MERSSAAMALLIKVLLLLIQDNAPFFSSAKLGPLHGHLYRCIVLNI
ncbi:hypothetical protein KP509_04G054800 [Ceratopteris richardii]|uniref:Uncharacterized protein n=1 Tax=Ceratopteris richardii TaxID=49495 RepID=A0A8T2USU7_CERRI|nr:hypothetical protein KP509_04G054800 [Ceratopteris richardii]